MKRKSRWMVIAVMATALGWVAFPSLQAPAVPQDQPASSKQAPPTAAGVLQSEVNLVLVDVVAQDKKGNYIQDLDKKEFHVLEDDQEQTVTTFSHGAEAASGETQKRYLILFFDNTTMSAPEQARARESAQKFVNEAVSENRMMAVADFGGAFRLTQNFTANRDDLKRAVEGIKFGQLQPNDPRQTTEIAQLGRSSVFDTAANYAARSVLLAIRGLAKSLRPIPGRKTVVLFSSGFPLNAERQSELTATIDAANKANVAIYPVDVRGLSGMPMGPDINDPLQQRQGFPGAPRGAAPGDGLFPNEGQLLATSGYAGIKLSQTVAQRTGGGGGNTGGTGGGGITLLNPLGTGGGTQPGGGLGGGGNQPGGGIGSGTRGGFGTNNNPYDPTGFGDTRRPGIIPPMLDNVSANQQILYALATGTGGFTIADTNDFLKGLSKISKEMDEYYVLGYAPPPRIHDGSYHKIIVKIDRKGVKLRFRTGYYDVKGSDILSGRPEGKTLEEQASSSQNGKIPVSLSAPYFYTQPEVARVNLALAIPLRELDFQKDKGRLRTKVNILGIAYRQDGSVAARFSDSISGEADKKDLKESSEAKFSYENSFQIAPGAYTLKVVVSGGGESFGKFEVPLAIAPFDGKALHISDVALSSHMQPISAIMAGLEEQLLEEKTPLVSRGIQLTPSPDNHFKTTEKVGMYVEVYEPSLAMPSPPRVGITFRILDKKTNAEVHNSRTILLKDFIEPQNTIVPVGLMVPLEKFQPGEYRMEVVARNERGSESNKQFTDFVLE